MSIDTKWSLLSPEGQPEQSAFQAAGRSAALAGKTIGLFWNGKNGGQTALRRTRENLERAYPGIKFIDYLGSMGGVMRRASEEQLDQIARECDAVIGTTAD